MKRILHNALGEDWEWHLHTLDDYGKPVSRIQKKLTGSSIFKRDDWPQLISFFKPRIIGLDEFWSDAKYAFEALR